MASYDIAARETNRSEAYPGPPVPSVAPFPKRPLGDRAKTIGSLFSGIFLSLLLFGASETTTAKEKKTKAKATEAASPVAPVAGPLPAPVAEMREHILAAVQSGDIEDLRTAIEWNEIPPVFSDAAVDDPILFLKKQSADGQGREILAILGLLLETAPTKLALGRDPENSAVYVWPALAELPLDTLTPAQEVALYRLMPVAEAKAMRARKKWTWYRLAIGADGTWHSFKTAE